MGALLDASGNSFVRRFFGRMGAVARIGALSRTELPPSVDPARGTDPRWIEWPRPDPASIPIADVTQFRELVYGAHPWHAAGASPIGENSPAADSGQGFTPADRIVGTLKHLRGMYGL